VQSIEINTTQHVAIEYQLAELRQRFNALLLDLIILAVTLFVIALIIISIAPASRGLWTAFGVLAMGGLFVCYAFLCESFMDGQTVGKRSQAIKVVRLDGKEVQLSDFLLRAVLQLVDFYYTAGVAGSILITTSDKRQRLGDIAAGTTVVRCDTVKRFRLQDILNIASLQNYQPAYPQVRQLTEDDVFAIRDAIARYDKYPTDASEHLLRELTQHLCNILDIPLDYGDDPTHIIFFLKTLIKDYVVLTR